MVRPILGGLALLAGLTAGVIYGVIRTIIEDTGPSW